MRGMCSAILFFEAVVIALATPVMIQVEGVNRNLALVVGLGLAVLCFLTIGMLGSSWGYTVGHGLQVSMVGLGFLVPIMFLIGAMFVALWWGAFALGRKIAADRARWEAEGLLGEPDAPTD